MPDSHRLAVVIPTFNNWHLTERCLATLFEHAEDTLAEVVVVDNGSTDETPGRLSAYPGIKPILFAENRGFAHASNAGARASGGDAILFLNNDAFTRPGTLVALLGALDDAAVGIVGARLLYADGTLQHAGMALLPDGRWWHLHRHLEGDLPDALIPRDYAAVTGAAMVMRRSVFDALGGFDERYRNGYEDVDLCLRAWQRGIRVRYEPRAVFTHLEGATQGRNTHETQNFSFFTERWRSLLDRAPRFKLDPAPPIAIVGEIAQGDVASQAARQFCLGYEAQSAGVRYFRHRPLARPLSTIIPRFIESKLEPVLSFEWGTDVPHTRGLKRILYAAPVNLEQARAISWHDYESVWTPTYYGRALLAEAGVPKELLEVVGVGIACQAFTPDVAPYAFPIQGLIVLAFVGADTTDAALLAMLQTAAHIDGPVTLTLITSGPREWIEEKIKTAHPELTRQGLSVSVHVASTSHLPDGILPGFFTGSHVFLVIGGDPYGYGVLAALAAGSLVAALPLPPAIEFLTSESSILAATPVELGRVISRVLADPVQAQELRTMARFYAERYFSAVGTSERAAALARRIYWGPRDGASVAIPFGLGAGSGA